MLTIDPGLLNLQTGEKVLDAGCGTGRHTWELSRRDGCQVYCLDTDEVSLGRNLYVLKCMEDKRETNGSWCLIQGDVTHLPFMDCSFDKIVCSEVLEHIPDDNRGMEELVRVLKDGGILAVSVPTYITETVYWKISKDYYGFPGGHIRKYKEDELKNLLCRNNLQVFGIRHKHALHSIYWLLRCLFGIQNEGAKIPTLYHKFLVWGMHNRFVRRLESGLNLAFPKSVVIYTKKNKVKA